jgi:hypothetical protein
MVTMDFERYPAYSEACRPLIPTQAGRPFRSMPATDSKACRPPFRRMPATPFGGRDADCAASGLSARQIAASVGIARCRPPNPADAPAQSQLIPATRVRHFRTQIAQFSDLHPRRNAGFRAISARPPLRGVKRRWRIMVGLRRARSSSALGACVRSRLWGRAGRRCGWRSRMVSERGIAEVGVTVLRVNRTLGIL